MNLVGFSFFILFVIFPFSVESQAHVYLALNLERKRKRERERERDILVRGVNKKKEQTLIFRARGHETRSVEGRRGGARRDEEEEEEVRAGGKGEGDRLAPGDRRRAAVDSPRSR